MEEVGLGRRQGGPSGSWWHAWTSQHPSAASSAAPPRRIGLRHGRDSLGARLADLDLNTRVSVMGRVPVFTTGTATDRCVSHIKTSQPYDRQVRFSCKPQQAAGRR